MKYRLLSTPILLVVLNIAAYAKGQGNLKLETVTLDDKSPAATVQLLYRAGVLTTRPVILMLGSVEAATASLTPQPLRSLNQPEILRLLLRLAMKSVVSARKEQGCAGPVSPLRLVNRLTESLGSSGLFLLSLVS